MQLACLPAMGLGEIFFQATMSLKRFLYIEACLRFDDPSTRLARGTPLAPIFDIYEQFVGNCSKLYSPSDIVTIDEMLIGFRGRYDFCMYIPTKSNKYSIKMQLLADTRTFYLRDALIYCGKETKLLGSEHLSVPTRTALTLTRTISGSGRNITADNWYSSVQLAEWASKTEADLYRYCKEKHARNTWQYPAKQNSPGREFTLMALEAMKTVVSCAKEKQGCRVDIIDASHT